MHVAHPRLHDGLHALPSATDHPQADLLLKILAGETALSSAGFPYISTASFRTFTQTVPHLFQAGHRILVWLRQLRQEAITLDVSPEEQASFERAARVMRTMVFTASVTAPPDLWVLRQVLGTHRALGTVEALLAGERMEPHTYASRHGLSAHQLAIDLHLLHARGFLTLDDGVFSLEEAVPARQTLACVTPLPDAFRVDVVTALAEALGDGLPHAFMETWLAFTETPVVSPTWVATHTDLTLGYRLVPLVLAMNLNGLTEQLKEDAVLAEVAPSHAVSLTPVLDAAGWLAAGRVTQLGARVFARGVGPFGIIGAYYPYFNALDQLLTSEVRQVWVNRSKNVAASQSANRKTFLAGNEALDAYCEAHGFSFTVFLEHAVGQGEATRQRYERSADQPIHYFGADLEDRAIDEAVKQQAEGILPPNMRFIRSADIGKPERVIDFIHAESLSTEGAVMMVGNGFHEIREQTNERMTEVFQAYQEAGFLLIFTEETALSDTDLRATAWNTYHAGFRYVHEMSGQGLRPAGIEETESERWSWRTCAEQGGYVVLDAYSYRTRTIYPYRKEDGDNPSISVTLFCVPERLAPTTA